MSEDKKKRLSRWYFGGLSAAGAACFTHPLDTLKVLLQTQQKAKMGMGEMLIHTIKHEGFLKLYSGLSASVLRQLTYSMTRFAIYETMKNNRSGPNAESITFATRVWMAVVSGACGGFIGTPADMVNVRMQNDIKVPQEQRRNYKNAIHGLYKVATTEGFTKLFNGATMATCRAVIMTIGQISIYDQAKEMLLETSYFEDNMITHFTSSIIAAGCATFLTQPLDVLKTRAMSAKPGEYDGLVHLFLHTAKLGPQGFFKGFWPAFARLGPQTILTFLFFEQLRINFGITPAKPQEKKA